MWLIYLWYGVESSLFNGWHTFNVPRVSFICLTLHTCSLSRKRMESGTYNPKIVQECFGMRMRSSILRGSCIGSQPLSEVYSRPRLPTLHTHTVRRRGKTAVQERRGRTPRASPVQRRTCGSYVAHGECGGVCGGRDIGSRVGLGGVRA